MSRRVIKSILGFFGLQLRRLPDPTLPTLSSVAYEGESDPFAFWIANQHTQAWLSTGTVYRTAELEFLRANATPGSIVADIGAHHGIDTLPLSRWVGPEGNVWAFEANAENCLVLSANLAANRFTNVVVIHAAVSDTHATLALENESISTPGIRSKTVEAISLDEFFSNRTPPSLVKIDVEGYEMRVLRGARELLRGMPSLAIELHNQQLAKYGDDVDDLAEILDVTAYEMSIMCRPDWVRTRRITHVDEIPRVGVVNLLLQPR